MGGLTTELKLHHGCFLMVFYIVGGTVRAVVFAYVFEQRLVLRDTNNELDSHCC